MQPLHIHTHKDDNTRRRALNALINAIVALITVEFIYLSTVYAPKKNRYEQQGSTRVDTSFPVSRRISLSLHSKRCGLLKFHVDEIHCL